MFILLFFGHLGELRVILTRRLSKLRNFPGHISLPGGKADTGLESEWQVARREMHEEIGLDADDKLLVKHFGFTVDYLNILPAYLLRTFSAVRPCVGLMKISAVEDEARLLNDLRLNLNPGETSTIFSCPLRDFLYPVRDEPAMECFERSSHEINWGGIPWRLRSYAFLQHNENEADFLKEIEGDPTSEEDDHDHDSDHDHVTHTGSTDASKPRPSGPPKKDLSSWGRLGSRRHSETNEKIYDVWGLTANILHDLAEIVYEGGKIEREIGEEELIYSLWHHGNQLRQKERLEEEVKLIASTPMDRSYGFGDVLPRAEFLRLKKLYKL